MPRTKTDDLTTPDLVLLSLLAERPMHGYEANAELERREIRDWAGVSRPQVYYSLDKLARLGLIRDARDDASAAGRNRVEGPKDPQHHEDGERGEGVAERLFVTRRRHSVDSHDLPVPCVAAPQGQPGAWPPLSHLDRDECPPSGCRAARFGRPPLGRA